MSDQTTLSADEKAEIERAARIAEQNDRFRKTWGADVTVPGQIVVMPDVAHLSAGAQAQIVRAVQTFDVFTEDNNPYGDHTFGAFEITAAGEAEAAARVLAEGDHADRLYELAGDNSFTLAELVAVVSEASGLPMSHENLTPDVFKTAAEQARVPEMVATVLSNTNAGIAKGALFDGGGDLARLIGRPTKPFGSTITAFVRTLPAADPTVGHT